MKKIFSLMCVLIFMLAVSVVGQPAEITVECVQGLKTGTIDTLKAGSQVTFEFTYTNGYDARQLFDNLYKLSSPDGATWSDIDFSLVSPVPEGFPPPGMEFYSYIWDGNLWDGISPDYFRSGYYTVFGAGWVSGQTYGYPVGEFFDEVTYYLTFYLDHDQGGKHIVLDSATGTGTNWEWEQLEANPGPAITVHPAWGGPYEFYIAYTPEGEVDVNYSQDSGFTATGDIIAARTVTIPLTYSSELDWDFTELINCYQLNSPNGIFWTDFESMPLLDNIGDLASYILSPHPDDMVGLRFLADEGDELEAPFETDMGYLTFKTVAEDAGKTITLDAYAAEPETWLWRTPQGPQPPGYIEPTWQGQITLTVAPCCYGMTGNTDCSANEEPDISDITRLIDFLYISHDELCCLEEADVNASGGDPDISDITALINLLYLAHDQLPYCPDIEMSTGEPEAVKVNEVKATSELKLNWTRPAGQ